MSLSVNGVLIPEDKIGAEVSRMRERYEKYTRENGAEPKEAELREWAEENLIEAEVFKQAAENEVENPSAERVRQYVQTLVKQGDQMPEAELAAQAETELRLHALVKKVRKDVPRPTEAATRAFYEAHQDYFVSGEQLLLSHLCRFFYPVDKSALFLDLLRIKSEIESARLDWSDAVSRFSDTAEKDGGMFDPVVRGDWPEAIESQLFALAPGQISDVIEIEGTSLHLFRLIVKEPSVPLPFKDVRQSISDQLFEVSCQNALDARLDALKASAQILRN